jgi:ribosomal protein L7Ae-like RNA K-turn-binding protein
MDNIMRTLNFLGIATKAGCVVTGDDSCMRMLRKGKISLLILAGDTQFNTRDRFQRACIANNVKCIELGDRYELGRFTGKEIRTVVGIMDDSFSKRLLEMATGVE